MRISQASSNVIGIEVGIIGKDFFVSLALSQEAKNQINGNPQAANNRLATEDILVGNNTIKKFFLRLHLDKIP